MHEDSGWERRDQSMGRRIAAMFLTDPAYPGSDEADQASQDSVMLTAASDSERPQYRTFRHDAVRYVPPERHHELAGHRNDRDPSNAPPLGIDALATQRVRAESG